MKYLWIQIVCMASNHGIVKKYFYKYILLYILWLRIAMGFQSFNNNNDYCDSKTDVYKYFWVKSIGWISFIKASENCKRIWSERKGYCDCNKKILTYKQYVRHNICGDRVNYVDHGCFELKFISNASQRPSQSYQPCWWQNTRTLKVSLNSSWCHIKAEI